MSKEDPKRGTSHVEEFVEEFDVEEFEEFDRETLSRTQGLESLRDPVKEVPVNGRVQGVAVVGCESGKGVVEDG